MNPASAVSLRTVPSGSGCGRKKGDPPPYFSRSLWKVKDPSGLLACNLAKIVTCLSSWWLKVDDVADTSWLHVVCNLFPRAGYNQARLAYHGGTWVRNIVNTLDSELSCFSCSLGLGGLTPLLVQSGCNSPANCSPNHRKWDV